MNDEHDHYRDWSAAYVLGALEPSERDGYERHLRSCPTCQADVRDFAPLPALLSRVAPSDGDDPAAADRVTDLALARVELSSQRRRERIRRWRLAAVVSAAAALLIVAIAGATLIIGSRRGEPTPSGTELVVQPPADPGLGPGATGSVRIDPRGWGTEIELDLVGLPERDRYQLWAIDVDGSWTVAATWGPTPTGRARLTGAAAVVADTVERVVITSDDRSDVVLDAEL